jgi:hypothetical protein
MNKQKLTRMPQSIAEFGIDHQIWTDRDLIKFCAIVFVVGFILGKVL